MGTGNKEKEVKEIKNRQDAGEFNAVDKEILVEDYKAGGGKKLDANSLQSCVDKLDTKQLAALSDIKTQAVEKAQESGFKFSANDAAGQKAVVAELDKRCR